MNDKLIEKMMKDFKFEIKQTHSKNGVRGMSITIFNAAQIYGNYENAGKFNGKKKDKLDGTIIVNKEFRTEFLKQLQELLNSTFPNSGVDFVNSRNITKVRPIKTPVDGFTPYGIAWTSQLNPDYIVKLVHKGNVVDRNSMIAKQMFAAWQQGYKISAQLYLRIKGVNNGYRQNEGVTMYINAQQFAVSGARDEANNIIIVDELIFNNDNSISSDDDFELPPASQYAPPPQDEPPQQPQHQGYNGYGQQPQQQHHGYDGYGQQQPPQQQPPQQQPPANTGFDDDIPF